MTGTAQTGTTYTPADQGTGITEQMRIEIQGEVERQLNLSPVYRASCVTVPYAADMLSVTEDTIREWIKAGKLAASKVGNNFHIRISEIDSMLTRYATVVPMKDKRFGVNNFKKAK